MRSFTKDIEFINPSVKGTGNGSKVDVPYGTQFRKTGNEKELKPNAKYKTKEGYTYETNNFGRIDSFEEKAYYYSLEPRDALAFDLLNLRKIYIEDNVYKEILPNLREYARQAREDYYKKELKKE
ncbi:hypothetical protein [Bacillus mycoides]|uniref:hypothetical protein n=1 Tax=Bacillus mycoides TaxID=1405 RepID=UPI00032E6CF2|nr:hypothetical protein [Bacillus mycoides]EOO34095.1 hypothetical protein IKK_05781 [Bacillus mycoides]